MKQDYVLSVSQLNEYAASLIGNDALLAGLSLRGEVSGFKRHTSGHLYFSMKDEKALVRCVMFRQNALSLRHEIHDGMQIVARGYASIYTRDGQFQFYVKSVEDDGEGELYRRFIQMKNRLEAAGMFDMSHKREIPKLPRCVGIVTSASGAAVQDITHIIRRRYPSMDMILSPAQVQGEGAAEDIAEAIRAVERDGRADVLIVGRGGGSLEDLWAFNEETVAQAIYQCTIPVISAVGHETDFTIADFVADLRAPTPSAAAELCVPEYEAVSADVEELWQKLTHFAKARIESERMKLDSYSRHSAFASLEYTISTAFDGLRIAEKELRRCAKEMINKSRIALETDTHRLEALAPQRTLARGFAIIKTDAGAVSSVSELKPEKQAQIIMKDGTADVTIERIKNGEAY